LSFLAGFNRLRTIEQRQRRIAILIRAAIITRNCKVLSRFDIHLKGFIGNGFSLADQPKDKSGRFIRFVRLNWDAAILQQLPLNTDG
jgi:hypothetical protein